jgi:hypothetical protein
LADASARCMASSRGPAIETDWGKRRFCGELRRATTWMWVVLTAGDHTRLGVYGFPQTCTSIAKWIASRWSLAMPRGDSSPIGSAPMTGTAFWKTI